MGKEKYLGLPGKRGQNSQGRGCPPVIKIHKDVIEDEGYRFVGGQVSLDAGQAES